MCTGCPLFRVDNEDNLIEQQDLLKLAEWSDATKKTKLEEVQHRLARHLLRKLLERDPAKRCDMQEVVRHPFLTGEQVHRDYQSDLNA